MAKSAKYFLSLEDRLLNFSYIWCRYSPQKWADSPFLHGLLLWGRFRLFIFSSDCRCINLHLQFISKSTCPAATCNYLVFHSTTSSSVSLGNQTIHLKVSWKTLRKYSSKFMINLQLFVSFGCMLLLCAIRQHPSESVTTSFNGNVNDAGCCRTTRAASNSMGYTDCANIMIFPSFRIHCNG